MAKQSTDEQLAMEQFGPCPCECNRPRRKNKLTASDECKLPIKEKA